MNRVGMLVMAGAMVVGAAVLAAAKWAPGALQPAGAQKELSRLMVQGFEELDSVLGTWGRGEDDAVVQQAAADIEGVSECTEVAALEVPTQCVAPVVRTLSPFGPGCTTPKAGRVCVVTVNGVRGWRMESRWVCRESLNKS